MLDDAAAAEVRERTVTAVTDCRLVYLEKDALEKLKQRYPELQLRVPSPANIYGIFICRICMQMYLCVFYIYIGRSR